MLGPELGDDLAGRSDVAGATVEVRRPAAVGRFDADAV